MLFRIVPKPPRLWRRLARWLCLPAIAAAFCLPASGAQPAAKPHLVLILCDDLGYGDLGCYGNPAIKTPELDRLAAAGLQLTRCYASSPVCSPSRAGLLTGRIPNRSGILDWIPADSGIYLKSGEITLAERLRKAGYRTGHFGKWHLSSRVDGTEPTPGDHGFDYWIYTQNNAIPSHQNPTNFFRNGLSAGPMAGNSTSLLVDEAIAFLERERGAGPLFLNLWLHAPHEPVAVPAELLDRYPAEADRSRKIYYASVSLIDQEVGRLARKLESLGMAGNTVLFFTSDNGPETLRRYRGAERSHGSPGPLRGMKLHLTEGGIRVPGIFWGPGRIPAGRISDAPVSHLDLFPTWAEWAGLRTDQKALDGESITRLLSGRRWSRQRPLYWEYPKAMADWRVAMIEGDWKLLADPDLKRGALHHLGRDPVEAVDLSKQEPRQFRRMLNRAGKIQASFAP